MSPLIGSIFLFWGCLLFVYSFSSYNESYRTTRDTHEIITAIAHGTAMMNLAIGAKALGWW